MPKRRASLRQDLTSLHFLFLDEMIPSKDEEDAKGQSEHSLKYQNNPQMDGHIEAKASVLKRLSQPLSVCSEVIL